MFEKVGGLSIRMNYLRLVTNWMYPLLWVHYIKLLGNGYVNVIEKSGN